MYSLDIMKQSLIKLNDIYKSKLCEGNQFKFVHHPTQMYPVQGLNPGLPHCRRILYQLSRQGSPCTPQTISKNSDRLNVKKRNTRK